MMVPLANSDAVALVDPEGVEHLLSFDWRLSQYGYAVRGPGERQVYMHRELRGPTGNEQTDHRNGNKLDNRRVNLRKATASQNKGNDTKRRGVYSSVFKGVGRSRGLWRACITVDGRHRFLGRFEEEQRAAEAYDAAAREAFGAFACVNFPRPGERGCRA